MPFNLPFAFCSITTITARPIKEVLIPAEAGAVIGQTTCVLENVIKPNII